MSNLHVVAIIQARMASNRLPGKVLKSIDGKPMLRWVVERTRLSTTVNEVVVATTVDPSDDEIAATCREQGYEVYRGSQTDVLDRYWQAAELTSADVVVRITADCPLIDPGLIDEAVETLLHSKPPADFVTNRLPWKRTYPIGLDVEVCTRSALKAAWEGAEERHQREHVMPYLYEQPDRFEVIQLDAEEDYGDFRWTVDTHEDLQFIRALVTELPGFLEFNWRDILSALEEHPSLMEINAGVQHKTHLDVE
ncbi:MAG: glycosyltransferase family protein [Anaerolineales bacterium]|jgi:spore coat polysaccharide biosynthesis protein SpsF